MTTKPKKEKLKYFNTLAFTFVKLMDYISTKLNFSLIGDSASEANPIARYLFAKGDFYFLVLVIPVILFILWAENKYREVRLVLNMIRLVTLLTFLMAISNFVVYFMSWKILHQ